MCPLAPRCLSLSPCSLLKTQVRALYTRTLAPHKRKFARLASLQARSLHSRLAQHNQLALTSHASCAFSNHFISLSNCSLEVKSSLDSLTLLPSSK